MIARDFRDLVIEELADENATLAEDVRAYRELARAAMGEFSRVVQENNRLRTTNLSLRQQVSEDAARRVA